MKGKENSLVFQTTIKAIIDLNKKCYENIAWY